MDKLERAYCLHKILQQSRHPVSLTRLCDELQCKEATVKRQIYDMRLYLDAPIINKPGMGYSYAKNTVFELPGTWFSAGELHALLTIQQLTSRISGGFLGSSFALLRGKIETILNKTAGTGCRELGRVRILEMGARSTDLPLFPLILEICRHGPDVEVVEPSELKQMVMDRLRAAADQYRKNGKW